MTFPQLRYAAGEVANYGLVDVLHECVVSKLYNHAFQSFQSWIICFGWACLEVECSQRARSSQIK